MGKKDKGKLVGQPIPDEPGVIGMKWLPKQTGLEFKNDLNRRTVAGLLAIAVVVCILARFLFAPESSPESASYGTVSSQEPSPLLVGMAWGFGGLLALTGVLGIGYVALTIIIKAYEKIQMTCIRVDAARVVPKADNGHLHVAKDGTVSDLEASPSRQTTRRGRQPEPESAWHAKAVEKTRMAEMVRGAGGGARLEWEQEQAQEPPFQKQQLESGSSRWDPVLELDSGE